MRLERARIEQPPPTLSGAIAILMIAARPHPWRRRQQCRPRREKVGVPAVPAIAPWRADTARMFRRAGVFPIQIIADMDDEIGAPRRRMRGHRGEGIGLWI